MQISKRLRDFMVKCIIKALNHNHHIVYPYWLKQRFKRIENED